MFPAGFMPCVCRGIRRFSTGFQQVLHSRKGRMMGRTMRANAGGSWCYGCGRAVPDGRMFHEACKRAAERLERMRAAYRAEDEARAAVGQAVDRGRLIWGQRRDGGRW